MSELRIEQWTLPAADLGPENPLPSIGRPADLHADIKTDDSVGEEDRQHLGWGQPPGVLPYRLQDGFNRQRRPRTFTVATLENEHLRATFFPELGGRLWSLVAKRDGRQLLARNPVFQPCNLALRTAWISGGVEWNLGWTGHWPLTCSPLFAARHVLPDGTPALRMWEWERVRGMPFQIDAWLPDGSPVLLVRIAIRNPHETQIPVYWWSNITVEQTPDTRVLAPADDALVYSYARNALVRTPLPRDGGDDLSYPGRERGSRDCFFRVPTDARPWIASLDAGGRGLFQTSTSRLRGRKLFRWGMQTGGRQWQRFLETPDYIEIQAGLARTQSHHLPMPPRTTWSWIEAYGDLSVDSGTVHGVWQSAREATAAAVESVVPDADLERALRDSAAWADAPVHDIVVAGSGWGALEEVRRNQDGAPYHGLPGVFYSESSIGPDQTPWRTLLKTGALPEVADPLVQPGAFVHHEGWMARLQESLSKPTGNHWAAWFHFGVQCWHAGNIEGAVEAWRTSCERAENPWARRCLGVAATVAGRRDDAVDHLARAFGMLSGLRPLAVEYATALLAADHPDQALAMIAALPTPLRHDGRLRLLEGRALLALGRLDELERLLDSAPVPDDMREGESAFCDLWFEVQARKRCEREGRKIDDVVRQEVRRAFVPPTGLDYRMG